MVLSAFPSALVHSFDLCGHAYARPNYELLRSHFAGRNGQERIALTCGNSLETVPAASKALRECDVVRVDGGHSFDVALGDLLNARKFAIKPTDTPRESDSSKLGREETPRRRATLVLLDDCAAVEVAAAWQVVVGLGFVTPLRPGVAWKGSCVGHYT
jgi:hypothetical protein